MNTFSLISQCSTWLFIGQSNILLTQFGQQHPLASIYPMCPTVNQFV